MSDNESFVSIDNASEEEKGGKTNEEEEEEKKKKQVVKNPTTTESKCLDTFLDFDINYLEEEEKCNYVGPTVCPRIDYVEVKSEKVHFLENQNIDNVNHILNNRTKEEINTFFKLKKELFTIAYKNQIDKLKKNKLDETDKEEKQHAEDIKRESDNTEPLKSTASYDLLNHELLSAALGNKIEDTYNDIKSGVNWIGNFFSNTDNSAEKKQLCVFYSDLYFFNDITIIRYLDTYKFNLIKTLNKIVKCIMWRQVNVAHFNEKMDARVKNEKKEKDNEEENNKKMEKEKHITNQTKNKCFIKNIFVNPKHIKNSIIKTNIFRCGFDIKSRPILYLKIQDKLSIEENDLFLNLVYNVDMCMNSVNYNKCYEKEKNKIYWNNNKFDESVLQIVVVVDCLRFDLNNMISVDCIKKIINCFNEFYTDVLYRMYIINVPTFFKKVWSLFNMFIDNITLKKIIIVNKNNINMMYEHISQKMMKHFDRSDESQFENSIFFPSTTLYYKYDEQYYSSLMNYVNTWVDKMISANHG